MQLPTRPFAIIKMMARLIIIRGYPGSGKTTLGRTLAAKGAGIFIDHNVILNCITSFTGDDDGLYDNIHELEIAMADKLLQEGKSVIVARGFSSTQSLKPYIDLASKYKAAFKIVRLEVPVDTLMQRINSLDRSNDMVSVKSETALRHWLESNPMEECPGENKIDGTQEASLLAAIVNDEATS